MILNIELDIDHVLVTGEHGRFLIHGLHLPLLKDAARRTGTIPHLSLAHLCNLGPVDFFNGPGQMIVRPRIHRAVVRSKTEHHPGLIGLHNINTGSQPYGYCPKGQPFHPRQRDGGDKLARVATIA